MTAKAKYPGTQIVTDGNSIISQVAYKTNGGIVIYTITPSSPFGEEAALRAAAKEKNIYGVVPQVFMACDEAAAAAAIQGVAAKGVGAATASSSQGILLMIPEMYNSAGQLLPITYYIGARDITRQSLTIFAGHSDVYAVRDTGINIIFAKDAQELQDLGAIGERLKWEASLPVAVVYDGFHTSHRQTQVNTLSDDFYWEFMPHQKMVDHKKRSLDPAHPTVWGTNENPDGYMQGCLAQRPHSLSVGTILPRLMTEFGELTGRPYTPYEYTGHNDATDVIVAMGSSVSTLRSTTRYLLSKDPQRRIGVINVRAFRPFLVADFIKALPKSVERLAVLDRTMTHTAQDEPLCADVRAAVSKSYQGFSDLPRLERLPIVSGGVYGLAGKDFHPGSVLEVFNHLDAIRRDKAPWTNFTVGVVDDVMHSSLPLVDSPNIFSRKTMRQARIVAYGSDGSVSMVKSTAGIYAQQPNPDHPSETLYIGSHAEYDSKKAGGVTVSHFRASTEPFEECFDVHTPDYVAVHHPALLTKRKRILDGIAEGGTLAINTPDAPETVFANLPAEMQAIISEKKVKVFAIDAFKIAVNEELGNKISMIMQRVLFDRFGLIEKAAAEKAMEAAILKAFSRKGPQVVERNIRAYKLALEALEEVPTTTNGTTRSSAAGHGRKAANGEIAKKPVLAFNALDIAQTTEDGFRKHIQELGIAGRGDEIPVSAYYEHARGGARPVNLWKGINRSFATNLPSFYPHACNECGDCVFICPTGGALDQAVLNSSQQKALNELPLPRVFRNADPFAFDSSGGRGLFDAARLTEKKAYGLAVDPNLCTGCGICQAVCQKDAIVLKPTTPDYHRWLSDRRKVLDQAREMGGDEDPQLDLSKNRLTQVEMESLPNYVGTSGACAGCYEPLYVSKFLQLYPHTVISNATGCSSIWGAQAYETPYSSDKQGVGAAWVNPLFENNAAVGGGLSLGMAQETDQMQFSGTYVAEALKNSPELLSNVVAAKLLAEMTEMDQLSQEKTMTLADRVEKVEFIQRIQRTIGQVLPLEQIKRDQKLHTHLALLESTITSFLKPTTLIVGGDGWAFDIGLQMMIHILQSPLDVVVMVLVTDVYSNTGGQMSKATPMGMDAPFAPGGKQQHRFPLGLSVAHGDNAFVAQVNLSYPNHLLANYRRAAEFQGPSLLLCYVPCMTAQKFPARLVPDQANRATTTRYWPLWSYDPSTSEWNIEGNPEGHRQQAKFEGSFIDDFARHEGRFRSQFDESGAPSQLLLAQEEENHRIWRLLQKQAGAQSMRGGG